MTESIDEKLAAAMMKAALRAAAKSKTAMNVAIVDRGANLLSFVRMDGAWLGSIDIAIKKAKTARMFDMPTGKIGELSQPGGPLYGIEHSNGGLITFPGGLPVFVGSACVGAVGVSGGTVEQDARVAETAVLVAVESASRS